MTFYTNDFGVNFAYKRYNDSEVSLLMKEAYNNGVDKVLSISNNMKESRRNIKLAEQNENLHFTLGVHPHNAKQFNDEDLKFLEENLKNPKCFGIGECGLDYNRMFSSQTEQINAFRRQIELAKKYNSKLYLHCRDAYDDFIALLHEFNYYNGIVHCFTGTLEEAIELTSLGFKLGITGCLFDIRRNANIQKIIRDKRITLDMLIVETDAPFMAYFGKKESVPQDTGDLIYEIASIKNIDPIECGNKMYENSLSFLLNSSN